LFDGHKVSSDNLTDHEAEALENFTIYQIAQHLGWSYDEIAALPMNFYTDLLRIMNVKAAKDEAAANTPKILRSDK